MNPKSSQDLLKISRMLIALVGELKSSNALNKMIANNTFLMLILQSIIFLVLIVEIIIAKQSDNEIIEKKCLDCKLTSESIEELIRLPRQMDSYGQVEEKIDLEKIKKRICKDISDDAKREDCRHFYFTHLDTIRKWKNLNSKLSFFDFVCIKELKFCCPRNSYGPKCSKCVQCNVNEHCHGEGTRQGNGSCVCEEGHFGPSCSSCHKGYYPEKLGIEQKNGVKSDSIVRKVLCKPCHRSCLYCRHGGPLGCEVCRKGFTFIPEHGCSDVDECIQSNNKICGDNTFCVNTEGSYFCYECDRACDGCYGDGPDMCLKCKKDYEYKKGNCVALKKTILPPEANYYRYAIYTGLLICAGIILHNNIYIASIIGLSVAAYISFSEYIMSTHLEEMEKSN